MLVQMLEVDRSNTKESEQAPELDFHFQCGQKAERLSDILGRIPNGRYALFLYAIQFPGHKIRKVSWLSPGLRITSAQSSPEYPFLQPVYGR